MIKVRLEVDRENQQAVYEGNLEDEKELIDFYRLRIRELFYSTDGDLLDDEWKKWHKLMD